MSCITMTLFLLKRVGGLNHYLKRVGGLNHHFNIRFWFDFWFWFWYLTPLSAIFQLYHGENKLILMRWWWGPLCTRQTHLVGFLSSSSLKQQPTGRHFAPLGYIILIPSQPVFALSPKCCVLSVEATQTIFIVFGLIR
jgi:hypothetical protein